VLRLRRKRRRGHESAPYSDDASNMTDSKAHAGGTG
jgi:hypothetical protein